MGLGGTAKKLQKVMDAAEQLYSKMNEVIERLTTLEGEVEHTSTQVDRLERDVAEQRALVEAIAKQHGLDVDAVLEDADLPAVSDDPESGETTDGDSTAAETGTAVDVTEES
jgi:DNA anti-recombination protein RmuC